MNDKLPADKGGQEFGNFMLLIIAAVCCFFAYRAWEADRTPTMHDALKARSQMPNR
jgi:hypothetical protein